MLRHYLAAALQHFNRFRLATVVNVMSFALGLACLVVTYAVMTYLSKSDLHFGNADRIQIVSVDLNAPAVNARFDNMPLTGPIVADLVRAEFPQLEAVARRTPEQPVAVSTGDFATFASVSYADPELLDIFDFESATAAAGVSLRAPHSALLTREAAKRIFGSEDVLGRRLRLANREEITVAGLLEPVPKPTRFSFEILVSMDVLDSLQLASGQAAPSAGELGDWWWLARSYVTYAMLPADGSIGATTFNERLATFSKTHTPKHASGNTLELGSMRLDELVINMMNAQVRGLAQTGVSITTVAYVLAGLVLFIASLNYANLAAALTAVRSKEVGLRKVLGAGRRQIARQHLLEAALVSLCALLLMLLFVALLVPLVRRMGFEITGLVLLQPAFAAFLLLLLATVVLIGGAYPAVVLSSIRPTQVLRIGASRGVRRFVPILLVTVQFAASSFLVIVVLVMQAQNGTVLKLGNSVAKTPAVVLETGLDTARVDFEVLRTRLLESPHIASITAIDRVPLSSTPSPLPLTRSPDPAAKPVTASIYNINHEFFSTLNIGLLAGRDFSRQRGEDRNVPWGVGKRPNHVVIGATLAAEFGWIELNDAIGETIYFPYGGTPEPMTIIGVVEEKPLHLMGLGARSSIYFLTPRSATRAAVRIAGDDIPAALAHIDAVWKDLSPHVPLRRQFLDDLFEQSYRSLLRISALIGALAVLGCGIATVGLFGMSIYITARRTHEIGVRKTLGARTAQIFVMFLSDFSKPVIVANLIAWPLAFIASQLYLRLFADRIALTPIPFVIGLLITLSVAWLAVGNRAYRTARIQPATVLRYE